MVDSFKNRMTYATDLITTNIINYTNIVNQFCIFQTFTFKNRNKYILVILRCLWDTIEVEKKPYQENTKINVRKENA
jgi:hypothetical protein